MHFSTDGCFSQTHLKQAGDGPHYHTPDFILPKEVVDRVGERITAARARPPRAYKSPIPDEAIAHCEEAHDSANDKTHKANEQKCDDMGFMSAVCRHDIPLFFANIDTPGEQQKYAVALLEHIASLLPKEANILLLYDVGCVFDRSMQLVGASEAPSFRGTLLPTLRPTLR